MVDVQLVRVGRAFWCSGITLACNVNAKDEGVAVGWGVFGTGFGEHEGGVDVQRDEADTVCEDFVDDDGGVVPDVDVLNGNRGYLFSSLASFLQEDEVWTYLSHHNPPKRIRNRRVHTDKIKVYRMLRQSLNLHFKVLP